MKVRPLAAGCGAALLLSCQGLGVPNAELPRDPIAIGYRPPEVARQRAEHEASLDPERRRQNQSERWDQLGVVPVDELRPTLEEMVGTRRRPAQVEHSVRLAFLHPDTREVVSIGAARRGARPQAWSPDRRRLLFSQLEGSYVQLFEYDLERESVRPITHGPSVHPSGCYGPDGRLVVMRAGIENGRPVSRIALTDGGGLNPVPVSPGPADHSPACAPDGSAVAWVSTPRPDRDQLFAVRLDGEGTPRRLGPGREPSFAPDGSLFFSARVQGQWQIWRIRPDGRGRTRIGRGVLDEGYPAVSPDGRHLAYVVRQDLRTFLYLRRIDGSGDRILFRDGDAEFPVW